MALRHEKAAIAMLLCSPSTLSKKWRAGATDSELSDELKRLGFSPQAEAKALDTMRNYKDARDLFGIMAERLRHDPWDGNEPHPTDPDGLAIVAALKNMAE